ncbi:hypothetical protein J7E96_14555 [Streptomyces sp. ISL-96]|nr:hypothetical protein [Streptomyces sp. ISL-96]
MEHEVKYAETEGGASRVAAHVERELPPGGVPAYLAARKNGTRSFALWADPHRRRRIATVVTTAASDGVATYQVLGEQGEAIGTLTRERALSGSGLRTRWTVVQTGAPEAVGFKGRIFWWYVWWLLFPVQAAIVVGSLVGGGGDAARGPRRIIWRTGTETPLEFRSSNDDVHIHVEWVDWRLAAALLLLVRSFGFSAWDDSKN